MAEYDDSWEESPFPDDPMMGNERIPVEELCRQAAEAAGEIQSLPGDIRNQVLYRASDLLVANADYILEANAQDMGAAVGADMPIGQLDRLYLNKERVEAMAEGVREVGKLPDPVGELMEEWDRPSGIHIRKVRVPLGVIGIIYESRPNVTADSFALTFKSGNAVVLKGGSEALHSNRAICTVLKEALSTSNVTEHAIELITSGNRADTISLMQQRQYLSVLIPRGGRGLIRAVVENSHVPVIETGSGNCHIYVDVDADLQKAIPIIVNAKTQRVGVCNAVESLVVHKDIAEEFLPLLDAAMKEHQVEVFADEQALPLLPDAAPATEADYGTEYLALKLSVKTVSSPEEAIRHINHYHTGHSDCIITENEATAALFQREVDSACVYVNASTRFTDGNEFGFGAEIGISTQKLHARGPMGLRELTSYKYLIDGHGEIRE